MKGDKGRQEGREREKERDVICRLVFPTLKTGFSLSLQISYNAQSVLVNLSGNWLDGFRGL